MRAYLESSPEDGVAIDTLFEETVSQVPWNSFASTSFGELLVTSTISNYTYAMLYRVKDSHCLTIRDARWHGDEAWHGIVLHSEVV